MYLICSESISTATISSPNEGRLFHKPLTVTIVKPTTMNCTSEENNKKKKSFTHQNTQALKRFFISLTFMRCFVMFEVCIFNVNNSILKTILLLRIVLSAHYADGSLY